MIVIHFLIQDRETLIRLFYTQKLKKNIIKLFKVFINKY